MVENINLFRVQRRNIQKNIGSIKLETIKSKWKIATTVFISPSFLKK